jgi:hypothetical protein
LQFVEFDGRDVEYVTDHRPGDGLAATGIQHRIGVRRIPSM